MPRSHFATRDNSSPSVWLRVLSLLATVPLILLGFLGASAMTEEAGSVSRAHEFTHRFGGENRSAIAREVSSDRQASGGATDNGNVATDHRAKLDELTQQLYATRQSWLDRSLELPDLHVTVLLVMQPGNRGIRRLSRTADPILCIDYHCYVSRGGTAPATKVHRDKAFGVANTFGGRAGACSGKTKCVFRNVPMPGQGSVIQPVDLRVVRHDRRAARQVSIDETCSVMNGRLSCLSGLRAEDYTVWIVPEEIANQVGPDALHDALRNDLRPPYHAALER